MELWEKKFEIKTIDRLSPRRDGMEYYCVLDACYLIMHDGKIYWEYMKLGKGFRFNPAFQEHEWYDMMMEKTTSIIKKSFAEVLLSGKITIHDYDKDEEIEVPFLAVAPCPVILNEISVKTPSDSASVLSRDSQTRY